MPESVLERSRLALQELMGGEFTQAGQALVAPYGMSPSERETLVTRYTRHDSSGFLSTLSNIVTNPFILLGAGLALKFPIPTLDRLSIFARKTANLSKDFPGARWLFDLHGNFKGSRVPSILEKIADTAMEHTDGQLKLISAAIGRYEQSAQKVFRGTEAVRVSAALDGLGDPDGRVWKTLRTAFPEMAAVRPTLTLTAPEQALVTDLRAILDKGFDDFIGSLRGVKPAEIRRLRAGLGIERPGDIRKLKHYFPHIAKDRTAAQATQELVEGVTLGDVLGAPRAAKVAGPSSNLKRRLGRMLPDPDALRAAGILDDAGAASLRRVAERSKLGFYTLDPFDALEDYTRSIGKTKAWLLPFEGRPLGDRLLDEWKALRAAGDTPRADQLAMKWIPMALGRMPLQEAMRADRWDQLVNHSISFLKNVPGLPDGVRKHLADPFRLRKSLGYRSVSAGITTYLASSTLGMNLVSPAINLLQTLQTTVPMIGAKATMEGVRRTTRGLGEMIEMRMKGTPLADGLAKVFPEFVAEHSDIRQSLAAHLEGLYESNRIRVPGKGRINATTLRDSLLGPFMASERVNRLVAFEGTRWKAQRELMGKTIFHPITGETVRVTRDNLPEWSSWAAKFVTRETQFGGQFGRPAGLVGVPAPLTQFASYPLRLLGNLLGGGQGFDLGKMGRAFATSGIAFELAKGTLGLDISRGLVTGGLPSPEGGGPFAPAPLIPPALQVLGAGPLSLATGDPSHLKRALPLLVPMGTQLARFAQSAPDAVGRAVAQATGRDFVGYEERLPDGRYPVYTNRGQLRGFVTSWDLTKRAFNIQPQTLKDEAEAVRYLARNADRIKAYRREFLTAIGENDTARAERVNQAYRAAYGVSLSYTPEDATAAQLRRHIPRLQQMYQTLPVELKPAFQAAIATTITALSPSDPSLLTTPPTPPWMQEEMAPKRQRDGRTQTPLLPVIPPRSAQFLQQANQWRDAAFAQFGEF